MAKKEAKKKAKKWIVNREMHLGFAKQSVKIGSIILEDVEAGKIKIDGTSYEESRDLDLLKKHGWVEKYSATRSKELESIGMEEEAEKEERIASMKTESDPLPVIQSDEDDHADIDISHTRKEKIGIREISSDMEIVRGDESAEERVARLQTEKANLPIVKDDSLGSNVGTVSSTGVKTRTAEEHKRLREEGRKKAAKGFTDERLKGKKTPKKTTKKATKKTTKAKTKPARKARKAKLDASVLKED